MLVIINYKIAIFLLQNCNHIYEATPKNGNLKSPKDVYVSKNSALRIIIDIAGTFNLGTWNTRKHLDKSVRYSMWMLRQVVSKKSLMLHLYVLYIIIYYYVFVDSHFVAYVCAQFIIHVWVLEVKRNQCCTKTAIQAVHYYRQGLKSKLIWL